MPEFSIKIEKILSRAHEDFKEQNTVLESSIIITNYSIIINAYYSYNVQLIHSLNYYIIFLIKVSYRNAVRKNI